MADFRRAQNQSPQNTKGTQYNIQVQMDDCDWNISGNWWRCGMAGDQRRARRVQAMTEQDVDKQDVARRDMDYNIF